MLLLVVTTVAKDTAPFKNASRLERGEEELISGGGFSDSARTC